MSQPSKIFVSWPGYPVDDDDCGKRLASAGYKISLHPKLSTRSEDELLELVGDAVAAIASTDPFSRKVLDACPNLKVIARTGVGYDNIDIAAATEHGICVSITKGLNASTVAEHTLALLFALTRKVIEQDHWVKMGRWERTVKLSEIRGKLIGVVGAGEIGQEVILRLRAFGARILYFSRSGRMIEGAERALSLDQVLSASDIITLHIPLTAETKGIIDAAQLSKMKRSAFLVNTSRGRIVDQSALFAALTRGELAGAALDVFETEPPTFHLDSIPNLICSAHTAGLSDAANARITEAATSAVLDILAGKKIQDLINPEALRNYEESRISSWKLASDLKKAVH
ncbi:MAG: phosphoglycerate dehydrogenase [Verrucomicrobia bacterium]|nr:phosphoglycerate dehydrogenase [Verrucomicrobiota bacterium]